MYLFRDCLIIWTRVKFVYQVSAKGPVLFKTTIVFNSDATV